MIVLVAVAIAILGAVGSAAATEGDVKLSSAVEVLTDDGIVYRVVYGYSFPNRDTVYIDGVGTVPAQGRLAYLSSSDVIQFLDSFGGQTLRTVEIEEPIQFMGGDAADLPRESDFPEGYRQGRWSGDLPFAQVALTVLDRFFTNGYRAYRRAEQQHFLTMFATLPSVSERVRAKVAVLVSSPVDANPCNVTFTVQFSARERRSHSEWRNQLGDKTQATVQAFVGDVIKALESGVQAQ
ncbi:MAG: hypothetical protein KAS72_15800 [Phycisphaerales bacterium]|nr:hypothetical protein [Phycisphaerales bacterium]